MHPNSKTSRTSKMREARTLRIVGIVERLLPAVRIDPAIEAKAVVEIRDQNSKTVCIPICNLPGVDAEWFKERIGKPVAVMLGVVEL